jgi:MFS family permease
VRSLVDVRPLRGNPTFRRLWAGSSVSALGEQFAAFAVIFYVWDLTKSPAAVGAISLAIAAPVIVLTLVGGSLADSMDRRRLALVTTTGQITVSVVIVGLLLADALPLWAMFVLVGVRSAMSSAGAPARKAFIPRLLPRDQVSAGLALFHLSFQISMLAGPAAAGVITAKLGVTACFVANAIMFLAALYGILGLPPMRPETASTRLGPRGIWQAARFVGRTPTLAAALLVDVLATALAMPIALFPVLNDERFGGTPQTLGLFLAALGAGGIIAGAFSGLVTRARRPGRAMLISASVWGAALACVGFTHHVAFALVLLAIAGGADMLSVIARGTIVQLVIPDSHRGRISAIEHIIGSAAPHLGNFRAGLVAGMLSGSTAFVVGGLMCVVAISAVAAGAPSLRRFDATATKPAVPAA